jgi:hypothetical protein
MLCRQWGTRQGNWGRRAAVLIAALATFVVVPSAAGNAADVTVTLTIYGTLGANGWYTSNVTVNWTVTGAASSTGCDATTLTSDTPGQKLTCSASNIDGTSEVTQSHTFRIDKTPPSVGAAPSRPPDANGWYNHALSVAFSGTDATAGIAGCSSAGYAGPDSGSASVAGSCTDLAGNVGTASFPFEYDATPPAVSKVAAKAGNRKIDLSWTASADTQNVEVTRTPGAAGAATSTIYRGPAARYRDTGLRIGKGYRYAVTAFDQAANTASKTVTVTATGALLSPVPGERVASRPVLAWTPVKGARYYNVQLVRGRKILSVWPTTTHFRLPRSWVFQGHRYRLHRGVYHWYVWPGFGKFSANRYGSMLGGSTFFLSG